MKITCHLKINSLCGKETKILIVNTDREYRELHPSPLLPKITMVGVSMGEAGKVNKATLKKTMEDLTKELECTDQKNLSGNNVDEITFEERDPLFVANVGDYLSSAAKGGSARWVRGGAL